MVPSPPPCFGALYISMFLSTFVILLTFYETSQIKGGWRILILCHHSVLWKCFFVLAVLLGVGAVLGGLPAFVGLVPCTRAPWRCSDFHVLSVLGLEPGTQCPNTLSHNHHPPYYISLLINLLKHLKT